MNSEQSRIVLQLKATPELARLVRMTAANVAMLSSMSVDRVEDLRMAAEEAFVYCCSAAPGSLVSIAFMYSQEQVNAEFSMDDSENACIDSDDPTYAYADLILSSVCDSYEKLSSPARLVLNMKADV